MKPEVTRSATEIIRRHFDTQEKLARFQQARVNLQLADQLHRLRIEAGLTQRELAERVGTHPSVISRLENENYQGYSIATLARIAAALGRDLEVEFAERSQAPVSERGGDAHPEPGEAREAALTLQEVT